jgi:small subunit ribosomal protein S21
MNKKMFGRTVVLKDGENINQALRKLKKKVDESGVLDELRDREGYIKPTVKRKKAAGAAKARWKKKLRDQQLPPKMY